MADGGAQRPCPNAAEVVRMIGGKWKLLILGLLVRRGAMRFSQLKAALDGVTQTMLTMQLRALEKDGLVRRDVFAEAPPHVEYSPTERARDLDRFFLEMHAWGARHATA